MSFVPGNQTLPLHLLHFTGVLNNEAVHLQWQSEQETNFSHYTIQRSFDGINFTSLGNMNGSSNNRNDYTYHDNDLKNRQAQKVFYRLQLIDKDGSFSYSKILRFDLKQIAATITVFPNPAVHSLNLSFTQGKPGKVTISIADMKGMTVKNKTENIPAGRASLNIDVSMLSSATYIISVINADGATQQNL